MLATDFGLQSQEFNILAPPTALTSSVTPRCLSYEDFCKRKAADRTTALPPAAKKNKSSKCKPSIPDKVKIQIGIKEFNATDGVLKVLKGRSLPVAVKPNASANDLLEET